MPPTHTRLPPLSRPDIESRLPSLPRQAKLADLFMVDASAPALRAAAGAPPSDTPPPTAADGVAGGDISMPPPPAPKAAKAAKAAKAKAARAAAAVVAAEPPALAEAWEQQWARDDALYYKCVLRLTQLRHAASGERHPDLSQLQVQPLPRSCV